jgi:dTDP-glucose pyrophosphorylase
VLPAAGRGTRLRAIARGRAKELLTVGGRSLIDRALADLAAGGITEALVVTSPEKTELARTLGERLHGVALRYVVQEEPRGVADALALAENFCAGEPFVCWLPDNVWSGKSSATAQLLDGARRAPDATLVGLIEVAPAALARHGAAGFVECEPLAGAADLVRIARVLDKGTRPPPSGAGPLLKGFPFDFYSADFFDRVRARRAAPDDEARGVAARGGELDDTPLLQELAREGRLVGVVLRDGRLFDCGIPEGLLAARAELGE